MNSSANMNNGAENTNNSSSTGPSSNDKAAAAPVAPAKSAEQVKDEIITRGHLFSSIVQMAVDPIGAVEMVANVTELTKGLGWGAYFAKRLEDNVQDAGAESLAEAVAKDFLMSPRQIASYSLGGVKYPNGTTAGQVFRTPFGAKALKRGQLSLLRLLLANASIWSHLGENWSNGAKNLVHKFPARSAWKSDLTSSINARALGAIAATLPGAGAQAAGATYMNRIYASSSDLMPSPEDTPVVGRARGLAVSLMSALNDRHSLGLLSHWPLCRGQHRSARCPPKPSTSPPPQAVKTWLDSVVNRGRIDKDWLLVLGSLALPSLTGSNPTQGQQEILDKILHILTCEAQLGPVVASDMPIWLTHVLALAHPDDFGSALERRLQAAVEAPSPAAISSSSTSTSASTSKTAGKSKVNLKALSESRKARKKAKARMDRLKAIITSSPLKSGTAAKKNKQK